MQQVLIALLPGIIAYAWFFGVGILVQILLSVIFAVGLEVMMLRLRKQDVRQFLGDWSAVVTAVLFALCLPPLAPFWVAFTGMVFAIVLAKHLYGGLGHNVFNPAMVGYVVVLISFPQALALWPPPASIAQVQPGLSDTLGIIFSGSLPAGLSWDTVSEATPLDAIRAGDASGQIVSEIRLAPVFGTFGGTGWEWIANFYALGGLWLLWRRVISWQVPVAVIGSTLLLGTVAYLADPGSNPVPLQHIFSGALVLGAFFIATDPVTGCVSTRGRLIFGVGVAVLTLTIRRWGGYPDGVAFAILLMNMAAPLIDRYTRPRIFGK
jgi:electron transport complex protein RnfD